MRIARRAGSKCLPTAIRHPGKEINRGRRKLNCPLRACRCAVRRIPLFTIYTHPLNVPKRRKRTEKFTSMPRAVRKNEK